MSKIEGIDIEKRQPESEGGNLEPDKQDALHSDYAHSSKERAKVRGPQKADQGFNKSHWTAFVKTSSFSI